MRVGGHIKTLMIGVGLAALGLTACGGSGGGGTSETTANPNTTPWRTLAPVAGTDTETTLPLDGGTITYTIQPNDWASKIAGKAGGVCTGEELLAYNPDLKMLPGRTMQIPKTCLGEDVTEESMNTADEADSDTTDSSDDSSDSGDSSDDEKYNAYEVKSGQSWAGIAKRTGCTSTQLKRANPGKKLHPGDVIKVPQSCDERDGAEEFTD